MPPAQPRVTAEVPSLLPHGGGEGRGWGDNELVRSSA
jgi:hypothetical protein